MSEDASVEQSQDMDRLAEHLVDGAGAQPGVGHRTGRSSRLREKRPQLDADRAIPATRALRRPVLTELGAVQVRVPRDTGGCLEPQR